MAKSRRTTIEHEHNRWECIGCDLPLKAHGLCSDCAAKLERDMIRARDWDYSCAVMLTPERQEALRTHVVREFGATNELLITPKPKRKNKRSHSTNTKRKRVLAAAAIHEYTTVPEHNDHPERMNVDRTGKSITDG